MQFNAVVESNTRAVGLWKSLGFEIIDCVYQDWKFQPPDFVASYGLHAALIVGAPIAVDAAV